MDRNSVDIDINREKDIIEIERYKQRQKDINRDRKIDL